MSLLCSVCHIFTTSTRIFSSIQLLVNEKFIHQSSFKLIKTFFICPASIYATLFIKVGGESGGGESGGSPRSVSHVCLYTHTSLIHVQLCTPNVAYECLCMCELQHVQIAYMYVYACLCVCTCISVNVYV